MDSIKSLQRGVCGSLRSSVVLFDLPRVVEELTCNSVDSGATRVYISINVKACYVKVEDDGCGITRDGLVILGERYATSKIHLLTDTDTDSESLGFRGEALASLTDVAVVEIRSKARRMPNAYCKILKGSNCLYFGIDDQREAAGTTVVVRDLFYNQPVRRNYMQSSPKRVLHSIKKCVLRIALVHPQVLFKVTDIASEDELLSTIPCSSPLPLVADGFGDEISSSLQKVVRSDRVLMLSGYISGLANVFSTKAFQYLYINSRFVCKGPIHNLINNLAASLQYSLAHRRVEPEFQSGKRYKTQGYPAFLLNLGCPLSSYDLHFEPSKTVIEFKDWNTILSFFEKAIKQFWEQVSEKPLQGHDHACDDDMPVESAMQEEGLFTGLSKSSKMKEAECDMQLHQKAPFPSSVTGPISLEDSGVYHKKGISSKEMHRFSWLKPCQRNAGTVGQAGCSSHHIMHDSPDAFTSPHVQFGFDNINEQWSGDISSPLLENNLFSDQTPRLGDRYGLFDREWRDNIPEVSGRLEKEAGHIFLNCEPFDIIDNDEKSQFPVPCFTAHRKMDKERPCSLGYEKGHSASYTNHSGLSVGFDHLGKFSPFRDSSDAAEADKVRSVWHCHFQENDDTYRPSASVIRKCQPNAELDVSLNGVMNSFSCEGASLYGKNMLHDGLASDFWVTDSKCAFSGMDWHLGTPQSLSVRKLRTDTQCNLGGHLPCAMDAVCRYSGIEEEEVETLNSVQNSTHEFFPARYAKTELDFLCNFSPKRNMQYGSQTPSNQITFGKVTSSALFNDETGWSPSESSNRTNIKTDSKYATHASMEIQDEWSGSLWDELDFQISRPSKVHKVRSRRSCSAPPFYKGKYRFSTLNDHLTTIAGKDSTFHSSYVSNLAQEETSWSLNGLSKLPSSSQPCLKLNVNEISQSFPRKCIDEKTSTYQMDGNIGEFNEVFYNQSSHNNAADGSSVDELKYALATPTKWRTGTPQPTDRDVSHTNKDDILNISSGLLHLSASSLIPESINKDCLSNARVLLQLDRKFIPVVAGEILVIIDQHAADERIRLEDLRKKVLSGEGNSVAYLDSEQDLVLPEMGYQLLQKYADQIQKWGWICNIHTQCSESFAKNVNLLKRRKCGITLIAILACIYYNFSGSANDPKIQAMKIPQVSVQIVYITARDMKVPCILGINLNDKDLIEFIKQLVETDGSSTIPPSVVRILNFKACRGAIMFGDSLLPSECSLILEELKATSLCFQCAHGRPTTVPLLNVASLREQLAILEMGKVGPGETWHGLRHHAPSIERAKLRLESAKRFQGG